MAQRRIVANSPVRLKGGVVADACVPFQSDDRASLEKLVRVLRLVLPDTNLNVDVNDEGEAYAHLWTADGSVNYFIEWTGDTWEGKPRGRIGLPDVAAGPSPGAVALMAAGSILTWLIGAAQAASAVLGGP